MEKLNIHSPDFTARNVAKLAELFPNCVTESKDDKGELRKSIDFDLLRQELSADIVEGPKERYRLDWPGKRDALITANAPITKKTLRPHRQESVDFDTTENLFIEGDNLDALKLLQKTYLGKVKMIYIDPPYNTGNDFIYKDNFTEPIEEYHLESGQKDEDGNRLVANPDSNGRFHSDWLSMMYPRLRLARNLLKDDGVIFISIDDHEVSNLTKLCDEIFGVENALVPFVWSLPRGINAGHISRAHEYILSYAKNKTDFPLFRKKGDENFSIERCNKKIDRRHPASKITFPAGMKYEGQDQIITGKIGGSEEIEIIGEMVLKDGIVAEEVTLSAGWTMKNMILDYLNGKKIYDSKGQKIEEFFFKENGKLYSKKKIKYESPKSVLIGMPDTQMARLETEALLGSQDIFPYPKPTELIKHLLSLTTQKGDIVLDFFSGSGSTAHAVFREAISKKLRFIVVQVDEELDKGNVDSGVAIDFCENLEVPTNVSEISKERIRRAGKKIREGNAEVASKLDIGFRVLKIDSSNMVDVENTPDAIEQGQLSNLTENIKPERTPEDLLFQVLLNWGVDLTLPITIEIVKGLEVFFVGKDALAACFAPDGQITEDLCKELAARKPLRVVFRDSGFENDSVKVNVEQIFKLLSPDTDVKTV